MQKKRHDMTLAPEQFRYLGSLVDVDRSPISPLPPKGETVEISDELKKQLVDTGALDSSGKVAGKAKPLFEGLGKAGSFARAAIGIVPFFEIMVYFTGNERIALLMGADTVTVVTGDVADSVPSLVAEYLGRTGLCTVEYDAVLSNTEAIMLGACVDARRRQLLAAIADDTSALPYPISTGDVADQVNNDGVQWISAHVRSYIGDEGTMSESDVQAGLAELLKKNMISEENDGYICRDVLETMATRFLVVNNRVTVQASRVMDIGQIVTTHLEMIRFGLSEILLIENKGKDQLHLGTISPNTALAVIMDLVSDPDALKELETVAEKDLNEQSGCPKCGASLAAGAKFCPECGAKIEADPLPSKHFCSKCGAELAPADKFCVECGATT